VSWTAPQVHRAGQPSLGDERTMLVLEEYARHNGHADLIRARIDGAVGT